MRFTLILLSFILTFISYTAQASDQYHFKYQYTQDQAAGKKRLYIIHFGFDNKAVSTLIVGPDKTMLVDVGRCHDDADEIIDKLSHINSLPYSHYNASGYVDYIVISHNHADHNGEDHCQNGSLQMVNGKQKFVNNLPQTTDSTLDYIKGQLSYDVEYDTGVSQIGDSFNLGTDDQGQDVVVEVIAENRSVLDQGTVSAYGGGPNAKSIAMILRYGDFVYYTGGDLTGGGLQDNPDNRTLDSNNNYIPTPDVETLAGYSIASLYGDAVDVVQIDHHGSQTSSNSTFLNYLYPDDDFRNAIINVNENYVYLPNQSVVERILDYVQPQNRSAHGNVHVWQTRPGGIYGLSGELSGTRHSVEDRNIWIRSNGTEYSIRSVASGGHKHTYTAIPVLTDDGDLIQSDSSNTVYYMSNRQKRAIASAAVFDNCGLDWGAVNLMPNHIISEIQTNSDAIDHNAECGAFSKGDLIKSDTGSNVYYYNANKKMHITSAAALTSCGFDWSDVKSVPHSLVTAVTSGASISNTNHCGFQNGDLFKVSSGSTVYVFENNTKRAVVSVAVFNDCGYDWGAIQNLASGRVNAIASGAALSSSTSCP